jgi:hypothetical protein
MYSLPMSQTKLNFCAPSFGPRSCVGTVGSTPKSAGCVVHRIYTLFGSDYRTHCMGGYDWRRYVASGEFTIWAPLECFIPQMTSTRSAI